MNEQRIILRQKRDLSEIIQAALHLYQQNFALLFVIASIVIPLGIASAIFQDALVEGDTVMGSLFFPVTILQAVASLLASAAVIIALTRIDRGQMLTFSEAYDAAFERFLTLLGAQLRAVVIVLLLAITLIGLPWAIQRLIRWLFVIQAVMIDSANAKDALSTSAAAVQGRWWRTLGVAVVIGLIPVVAAFIVGAVLIFLPVLMSSTVSSFVSALTLPFGVTAMTLLYLDLKVRKELDDSTTADAAA